MNCWTPPPEKITTKHYKEAIMKIEYTEVPTSPVRHRLNSLTTGQCVVRGGKVFVRPAALDSGRPQYAGFDVEAIAIDGSDWFSRGTIDFAEVYEIESITLRRVK